MIAGRIRSSRVLVLALAAAIAGCDVGQLVVERGGFWTELGRFERITGAAVPPTIELLAGSSSAVALVRVDGIRVLGAGPKPPTMEDFEPEGLATYVALDLAIERVVIAPLPRSRDMPQTFSLALALDLSLGDATALVERLSGQLPPDPAVLFFGNASDEFPGNASLSFPMGVWTPTSRGALDTPLLDDPDDLRQKDELYGEELAGVPNLDAFMLYVKRFDPFPGAD